MAKLRRQRRGCADAFAADTAKPFVRFPSLAGPMLVYAIWQEEPEGRVPVRVMEVDGAFQSAAYLVEGREYDPVFAYIRAYDCLYAARDADGRSAPCANLLMLGGGGYAWPKHVVAHHPESRIDVVELDPTVTAVAGRYFFLDRCREEFETDANGRLGLVCADALAYLESGEGTPYDAIANDLFSGRVPAASLMTPEAAALIHRRLVPGGLYLTNVISALSGEGSGLLQELAATFGTAFAHVHVLPVGAYPEDDRDNNLLIATDGEWLIPGAREL